MLSHLGVKIVTAFTAREKKLLDDLFSPESVSRLVKMFPDTSAAEWEALYAKMTGKREGTHGLILYVDGASDPRSRTAGIGGVLYGTTKGGKGRKELLTFSRNIGQATNNEAEYRALITGLEQATQVGTGPLTIYSDSELLVKQLSLEYKIKSKRLIKLYFKSMNLLDRFESWEIRHLPRGDNRKADVLSKQALSRPGEETS